MKKLNNLLVSLFLPILTMAQLTWKNVDSLYQPLPSSVHIYFTNDSLDGKPNIAYYVEADVKDKKLDFTTQVGNGKRYTPKEYYDKEHPLLVVNCTFFEYVHNSNLNLVVRDGKVAAYNEHSIPARGKDTFTYYHTFPAAIGISKKRVQDVAWTFTDSTKKRVYAIQTPVNFVHDSSLTWRFKDAVYNTSITTDKGNVATLRKWKMKTAVGGGPVLLQKGKVAITNNEEHKFFGKAIADKHPRTTMGYTTDGKLIILMIQGRFPSVAEGATLEQEARILQSLGCWEALNLDGGGSSCLLLNGKETIAPSDKIERPVPAVFMIKQK